MRFPLQIIQCPFRKKETVAVVVHKISELVLCKDRIFTNITPQVFTLTHKIPQIVTLTHNNGI